MQRHIDRLFVSVWFLARWKAPVCAMAKRMAASPSGPTSGSCLALPSSPGIEKPHRCTEETDPRQRRRFGKQPPAQRGIDHPSDEVEVPANLPMVVYCHVTV